MQTTELKLTIVEADEIAAVLRLQAERELADAEGKMHNAAISRIEAANRMRSLADRLQTWADAQQEAANHAAGAGVRRFLAARRKA